MVSTDIFITPAFTFLAILNLFGAVQGLLLTLALLKTRAGDKTANRLLAALTLTISIVVSGAVLLTSNYLFVFPHLSRLHHPFVFLASPLLFLYLRELTDNEKTLAKKDLLHFLPFAFCVVYLLPYYFKGSGAKLQQISAEYVGQSVGQWYYVRSALFITQCLVYLILIVLTLLRYSRKVKQRRSPGDETVLFEVRFFLFFSTILWIGAILRFALDLSAMSNLLVPLGASVLVYSMGYLRMTRAEPPSIEEQSWRKYEGSTLTPERAERYLKKLLHCMETEKPYIDADLTIQKLADTLSVPAHHLSQTINERLGQTFSTFINSYRVEEAKRKLLDPAFRHLSVLGIAQEVGFNSKSSFNSVFKTQTKTTPSEYRKIAR